MPKKSRHRKRFILGKQGTRKFRGGKEADLTRLKKMHKDEASLSWFKSSKESKLDISLYIAKSRAHVENLIVKSTVDLATKMYADIITLGKPSAKALAADTTRAKENLDLAIRNYKRAIQAGHKIGIKDPSPTPNSIATLMTGDDVKTIALKVKGASDAAHDKLLSGAQNPLPLEGELFNTAMLYIPEINDAMKKIYDLIEKASDPGGLVVNKVGVTSENVGKPCFDALTFADGYDKKPNLTPLLKDKYAGIYPMRVFFSKETYEECEKRLKLLYSLESFEKSYIGLAKMIIDLSDEPAVVNRGNGGKGNGKGNSGKGNGKGNGGKGNGRGASGKGAGGKGNGKGRGKGNGPAGRTRTAPGRGNGLSDAGSNESRDDALLKAIKTAGDEYERSMAFYAFLDVLKVPKTMEQSIMGSIKPFDGNVTSQQVTLLDAQISIYMSHVSANMPDSIAALTQARANTDPSIKLAFNVYTDSGKDFENTFIALLNNKARSYIISFKYEPEIRANALKAFNRSGATNNSSTQIIDKLTIKDEDTEADITAKKNALIVFIASENDNDITREALGKAISRPAARSVPPKKRQQVQAQSNGSESKEN